MYFEWKYFYFHYFYFPYLIKRKVLYLTIANKKKKKIGRKKKGGGRKVLYSSFLLRTRKRSHISAQRVPKNYVRVKKKKPKVPTTRNVFHFFPKTKKTSIDTFAVG
uniref:Uncharacterized protein n=1 Tax=Cacopsylla melanoneura TaxID=428564 RepID=A0A8D9EX12_9HEMI